MVYAKPIEPVEPRENDQAKFELIKAMGVAIAAIAKEKGVFISKAEIEGQKPFKMVIECVIPEDKETWETYSEAKDKYNNEFTTWVHARDCEKYSITEEERQEAENEYYQYRKDTGYEYPEKKSREDFYKEKGLQKMKPTSEIIEA